MQRMRNAAFDGQLGSRQRLAQDLPAKHLRTANVAAGTAKNIGFDLFELEERNEVRKNRVHNQTSVRPPSTEIPVPLTNTASSLARNRLASARRAPRSGAGLWGVVGGAEPGRG